MEIVADHVGNDEYSVVDGPSAPNEDDPYVEKGSPVLNDVETQKSVPIPKAVVEPTTEANQIPINEDLTATEKEAPKIPASDIEKSEEKKVDEKLQSLPVEEERKVTDTPPPVVQAPGMSIIASSKIFIFLLQKSIVFFLFRGILGRAMVILPKPT